MNDLIHFVMEQAVRRFNSGDKFNGAVFSAAFMQTAGLDGSLDGRVVRAMLCGRDDVEVLDGGSHYRMVGKRVP